jgi:hypothetical protein
MIIQADYSCLCQREEETRVAYQTPEHNKGIGGTVSFSRIVTIMLNKFLVFVAESRSVRPQNDNSAFLCMLWHITGIEYLQILVRVRLHSRVQMTPQTRTNHLVKRRRRVESMGLSMPG